MVDTGEFYLNFYYVFDLVTDAVLIVDQRKSLRYLNQSAEKLLGISLESASPIACDMIEDRLGHRCFTDESLNVLASKAEYRKEFQYKTADEPHPWLELRINHLLLPGTQETGFFCILRDITAQKEQEAQQQELQKQLQRIHRQEAITRLAGGIAHDFNNLMTSFMGNLDLLRMTMAQDDERTMELLNDLDHAATRATELTSQLLSFSRRKTSKLAPISLDTILREPLVSLRRALPSCIRLKTRMETKARGIKGDPQLVEEILNHLTDNAIEAMPDGGQLRVSVLRRKVDQAICRTCGQEISGYFTELRVEDTGLGMDQGVMDKLFDPFYSTKFGSQSRGLGLATVFGNMRHLRGHILVESELQQGSRFSVLFPEYPDSTEDLLPEDRAIPTSTPKKKSAVMTESPQRDPRLLMVEHDRLLRTVNGSMLSSLGFEILPVESAQAALPYLNQQATIPDALLIDESMPEMDVTAFIKDWLRENPKGVVLILSSAEEQYKATGYQPHELVEIFPKSFTPDLLGRRLRELLADQRGLSK